MNKTLVLFLAFAIVVCGIGFSAAADENQVNGITATSVNLNDQEQAAISEQAVIPGGAINKNKRTIPMQKTGLPVAPVLLSTLLIGSGLLYGKLMK